ncbi:MAG: RsmE family RNA methyltransferase [Thermodesulfovibrionaceae bacterium]
MSKIRLCINYQKLSVGQKVNLSREDLNYLFNVMRYNVGQRICLTDGKGKNYIGEIIDKKTMIILKEESNSVEDNFDLVLCQALLKSNKMELVIQKATELGVKRIIPFVSERCIIKKTNKIERWRRIAKEATEQSLRSILPEIENITTFRELLNSIHNGIFFWEKASQSLFETVQKIDILKPVYLIIGPEGGFTEKEAEEAKLKGLQIASLGKRVLRAETASIVATALLSFLLQNYDIIKQWMLNKKL